MRIVFTNSKSLVDIGLTGSAVYSVYSLMNHSCVPNTNLSIAKVETVGPGKLKNRTHKFYKKETIHLVNRPGLSHTVCICTVLLNLAG